MNNKTVKVPVNIEECFKKDLTALGLERWGDFLSEIARVCAWLLPVIGAIVAGVQGSNMSNILAMFGSKDSDLSAAYVMVVWAVWCVGAFLGWLIFRLLSHMFTAQAKLVQNSKIVADIAMYKFAKEEDYTPEIIEEEEQVSGLSFCMNCGSAIPDGAKFCISCGQKKV